MRARTQTNTRMWVHTPQKEGHKDPDPNAQGCKNKPSIGMPCQLCLMHVQIQAPPDKAHAYRRRIIQETKAPRDVSWECAIQVYILVTK